MRPFNPRALKATLILLATAFVWVIAIIGLFPDRDESLVAAITIFIFWGVVIIIDFAGKDTLKHTLLGSARALPIAGVLLIVSVIAVTIIFYFQMKNNKNPRPNEIIHAPSGVSGLEISEVIADVTEEIAYSLTPTLATTSTPEQIMISTQLNTSTVEIIFIFLGQNNFAFRYNTQVQNVVIRDLSFSWTIDESEQQRFDLNNISQLAFILDGVSSQDCIEFYITQPFATIPGCNNNIFRIPINPHERFWLPQNILFTVYQGDQQIGNCPTSQGTQVCSIFWPNE